MWPKTKLNLAEKCPSILNFYVNIVFNVIQKKIMLTQFTKMTKNSLNSINFCVNMILTMLTQLLC